MKSNYPRSSDGSEGPKPNILLYALGLGVVVALIMVIQFLVARNIVRERAPGLSLLKDVGGAAVIAAIIAGVAIVWKCSRWPVAAKAKLIALSSLGSWLVATAFIAVQLGPLGRTSNTALVLGAGFVTLAAMLTFACLPIWLLASLVRWMKEQFHYLERVSTPLELENELSMPAQSVVHDSEPEHVRTNA